MRDMIKIIALRARTPRTRSKSQQLSMQTDISRLCEFRSDSTSSMTPSERGNGRIDRNRVGIQRFLRVFQGHLKRHWIDRYLHKTYTKISTSLVKCRMGSHSSHNFGVLDTSLLSRLFSVRQHSDKNALRTTTAQESVFSVYHVENLMVIDE